MAVRADCTRTDGVIQATITCDPKTWQAHGVLVDPFDGQHDIANKVLLHVSAAFAEDPVRILRLARLAARFAEFTVAPQTLELMRAMVHSGEVDHLVAERVWQELAKGLMEATPSRMFEVLRDCGALARLLPKIKLESDPNLILQVLDTCARLQAPLPVRVACLLQKELESDPNYLTRLRLPTDCRELAQVLARERGNIERSKELAASELVGLLERCDALRKPQRFAQLLLACECVARTELGLAAETPYPSATWLLAALAAVQGVATNSVAAHALARGASGKQIGELIHRARIEAVRAGF